jgi:hypothetical protein
MTDVERQKEFRAKMYAAGNKQARMWLPRNKDDNEPMSRDEFLSRLDADLSGRTDGEKSELYKTLLALLEINFLHKRKWGRPKKQ